MEIQSINLPPVPTLDGFKYKHYFITQDSQITDTFHLHLFEYEPMSMEVNANNIIVGYQKYGNSIFRKDYTFKTGQSGWVLDRLYLYDTDFAGNLRYNNFEFRIGSDYYELNPMPDDQVELAPQVDIPAIPTLDDFKYKHYFIMQSRTNIEVYYLYLFTYEPASLFYINKMLCSYQKYENTNNYNRYSYTVGQDSWVNTFVGANYSNFADALIYNNFTIDIGEYHYDINPMPDDQVVPAAKPVFPEISNEDGFKYKHYFIVQDRSYLEQYRLYLLQYEPARFDTNSSNNIIAYQKYGKRIYGLRYQYSINQEGWGKSSNITTYQKYDDFVGTLIYNNFTLNIRDEHHEPNPMPDDHLIPAQRPQFPPVPYRDIFKYKHYYILQNKDYLERYHIYLSAYEPVSVEVNASGYVVVNQKYGNKSPILRGTYEVGLNQDTWSFSSGGSEKYSDLTDALIYHNFEMNFGDAYYQSNPMPEDQIVPAVEVQLPKIPYVHNVRYKHYYITQNKTNLERYHLKLFEYEPLSLSVTERDNIVALRKYGYNNTQLQYTYEIGQEEWKTDTITFPTYSDLKDALMYNNFTMDFAENSYERNPMPEDQVIPALEPQFPAIPDLDDFKYKQYFITQGKYDMVKYRLCILVNEPVSLKVENGLIYAYQQFGKQIKCVFYEYTIGDDKWIGGSTTAALIAHLDFTDALIYNNFTIDFGGEQYEKNPYQAAELRPAFAMNLPSIPEIGLANEYLDYIVIQDKNILEKYTLFLLKDKVADYKVIEEAGRKYVTFINALGKNISIKTYTYQLGDTDWCSDWAITRLSVNLYNESSEYNSFDIMVKDDPVIVRNLRAASDAHMDYVIYSRSRMYTLVKDGDGYPTTGWVEDKYGWYYYFKGYKYKGRDGWLEIDGKTYYLVGTNNWRRLENAWKGGVRIPGGYYFGADGVMVTGFYEIDGELHYFSQDGRFIVSYPNGLVELVSKSQLEDFFNQISHFQANSVTGDMIKDLNRVLQKHKINSPTKIAMFMATIGHESKTTLVEVGVGNTYVVNGVDYRGGGYIQMTGYQYNYKPFAETMEKEMLVTLKSDGSNPITSIGGGAQYVADYFAWESAGWCWTAPGNTINTRIDNGATFYKVSQVINGGPNFTGTPNGWNERNQFYAIAQNIFK